MSSTGPKIPGSIARSPSSSCPPIWPATGITRYQLFRFTPEGLAKSKEYCEQAIALDPDYALAWHGLAGFYTVLGLFGQMPPNAANAQAAQATRKALQLDNLLAEAYPMTGALRAGEFDWKGAELEFGRALELDPKSADVLRWYDHYSLGPMKRVDEAVTAFLRALERDPLHIHPRYPALLRKMSLEP